MTQKKQKPWNYSDFTSRVQQPLGGQGRQFTGIRGNLLPWQIINPLKLTTKGRNGSCNYPSAFRVGPGEEIKWAVLTFTAADGPVGMARLSPWGWLQLSAYLPPPRSLTRLPAHGQQSPQLCTRGASGQCGQVFLCPQRSLSSLIKSRPFEGRD